MGDELRNFKRVLKAFLVLAFVNPGVDLALAWRLVEGAVDLYRLEVLGRSSRTTLLSSLRSPLGRTRQPNRDKTNRYSPRELSFHVLSMVDWI